MKTTTGKEYWNLSIQERQSLTGIVKYDNGAIQYLENGNLHRLDGPQYEHYGLKQYYINNIPYTKEEFWKQPEVLMFKVKNSKEFQDFLRWKYGK